MASTINSTDTGSGGLITTGDSSDELQLQTAETTAITITSGQQSAFIAGTASAPAVTTTGDLNTGIYFPAADNIGFATGGTIRGRWTTDGLCFGSDTAAANALDDYEEGTFTAGATIGSGSVSVNATAVCRYTKIGNLVHVVGRPNVGGSGSGAFRITGLPFTAAAAPASGSGDQLLLATFAQSTGNVNQFIGYVGPSGTTIVIFYTGGTGLSDTAGAYIDADTDVQFGFTYIAA